MTVLAQPNQVSPSISTAAPGTAPNPTPAPASLHAGPVLHRWTPEEVMKMVAADVFEGKRLELIDGELFDMPPQENPHVAGISRTTRVLVAAFDESYWLTIQSTVRLPRGDMPEPDFSIRPGPASADKNVHPLPLLVIEVSDTTLLYDQIVKSSLYAANGIADYWILNVVDRQVEVYRNPVPDPTRRHGYRYATVNTFPPGSKISPLAAPHLALEIDRMLP
jgi:Uma2 family endonuclease